jgi:dCTP deaminase
MKNNTPTHWLPGLLADWQIDELCASQSPGMIDPFITRQVKTGGTVSYGLSSYGYDVRIFNQFKIFTNVHAGVIDPTDFNPAHFVDVQGDEVIIPPNGFVLSRTVEYLRIPDDVMGLCLAKSTWSRSGLVVGVTPLEPGFEGTVTLELSNTTSLPIRVKSFHGICQFLFLKASAACQITYADRNGKYQGQVDVTPPKIVHDAEPNSL